MATQTLQKKVIHLTPADLAERLQLDVTTLASWRNAGKGPNYIRTESTGRSARILYPLAEVEAWEKRQLVVTSAA